MSVQEHRQHLADWHMLECEGRTLIMQGSGLSFSVVLALIFLPSSNASALFATALLWGLIASLAVMVTLHENCRKWQDWHKSAIANPAAEFLLAMPGED